MTQCDTGHPPRPHCSARADPARTPSEGAEGAEAAMKTLVITASLLVFISGTRTEDFGFNLADALDEPSPAPTPKDPPKAPEKPGSDDGFSLEDALLPDPKTTKKPSAPSGGGGGGGGSFSDDDLLNTLDDGYKPDKTGSGGRAADSNFDSAGGADQPQEAGSGQIAGIVGAIGVALAGAASSYFAYQKKKLCFKLQGGTDPESGKGHAGTQAEPQVLSNLLQSN